jgi:phosphotransferase system IIA component
MRRKTRPPRAGVVTTGVDLLAPCDGRIVQIHEASHTITIETPEGVEVMMHVGIGTVAPKGRGFQLRTDEGAEVKTGDILLTFNADYVATHAKSLLTQIVITNGERMSACETASGMVRAGDEADEIGELGTPVQEAAQPETVSKRRDPRAADKAVHRIKALGGRDNINRIDACAKTRVRVEIRDVGAGSRPDPDQSGRGCGLALPDARGPTDPRAQCRPVRGEAEGPGRDGLRLGP